jgi:endonuclease/exonuclease/phosphatase family metal-dependent hydrolase
MRVLTWNLFHGRSQPPAGRDLSQAFAAALASWEWDAALLQEVPPWWPARIARAAGAEYRAARTSRNWGLVVRRAIAERRPDLIKSNGGGCNAVLARQRITEHSALRLRLLPERRVAQLVRLQDRTCVVNLHASAREELAVRELEALWAKALAFCAGDPLVLGGDLNLRRPAVPREDVLQVACRDVDHLFALGFVQCHAPQLLDRHAVVDGARIELSDHVPLVARLRLTATDDGATAG